MNLSLVIQQIINSEEYYDCNVLIFHAFLGLFIRFGKFINDTYGLKFTDYYLKSRKYQRDLSFELHQYYDSVDEKI